MPVSWGTVAAVEGAWPLVPEPWDSCKGIGGRAALVGIKKTVHRGVAIVDGYRSVVGDTAQLDRANLGTLGRGVHGFYGRP